MKIRTNPCLSALCRLARTTLCPPLQGLLLLLLPTACTSPSTGYDASGVFEATEVIVSAQGTGELLAFGVEEGQTVTQGEVLGYIDTLHLSLQHWQLEASLHATEYRQLDESRQAAALQQQLGNLQREKKRFAALHDEDAVPGKQVDDIDYQISVVTRQLDATREQLASANRSLRQQAQGIRAQLAQTDNQLRKCIISSPMTGVVLSKYTEQGEYAVPGKPLFKVADLKRIKLRAYLTAPQLTTLKIGQQVTVYADRDETGRTAYEGTVEWISDQAEFTPKTIQTRDERANLVYAVKIAVQNDGQIKRGMYGDLKF